MPAKTFTHGESFTEVKEQIQQHKSASLQALQAF